jgi:general secretion pathway protein E
VNTLTETPFSAAEVELARIQAHQEKRRIIDVLSDSSGASDAPCLARLGSMFGYQTIDMAELHDGEPALDLLKFSDFVHHEILLLRLPEGGLTLVLSDPFDTALMAWADVSIANVFAIRLTSSENISAWLSRHEAGVSAMDSALVGADSGLAQSGSVQELSFRAINEDASPVIRLVNSTIYDALRADASDIHLESSPTGMYINYRVDGVLMQVATVNAVHLAEQTISRIKVMSELDIAERRIPQDGRFRVSLNGREIDLRVSIMPSIHGEDAVLRILDKQSLTDQIKGLSLSSLGFDESIATQLRRMANEPYGMFLVTGPTGSGKTTTLYAAITEINHGRDKIVTIEDPVEYQLPRVLQIPVNEKKGLTFARGLRSILRHDPDKIMVGEIRDAETAQIAIQSALTGHLVFTTVHANNVFDVLGRFMHMGVDPYSFVSALNGVLAQRLVRVNCADCTTDYTPDSAMLADSGLTAADVADFNFRAGKGCGLCHGSGYRGRKSIAEVLSLNDEIRELIVARAPIRAIKDAAQRNGTQFLRASALELVKRGETTLEEINRVTFVS